MIIRHHAVAEPDAIQERRAVPVEQTAVVWGQTDRRVALIDGAAEIVDRRPIARRGLGEHVPEILAATDIAAHPVAERVVVVALIADRQQVAVLRIEDE